MLPATTVASFARDFDVALRMASFTTMLAALAFARPVLLLAPATLALALQVELIEPALLVRPASGTHTLRVLADSALSLSMSSRHFLPLFPREPCLRERNRHRLFHRVT